jgi:hypothetical protein
LFQDYRLDDDPVITKLVEAMLAKGVSLDEVSERLEKAIPAALPGLGECLLKGLHESAPGMLADRRQAYDGFRRRMLKTWGKSFELLRMLIESAREAGEVFNKEYRHEAAASRDLVFESLVRLHARACMVGSAILWLMEGGFASDALARWRTLHEIAVVGCFIAERGQSVAERYLLHHNIETYREALKYQEHRAALGLRPITKKQLPRLKGKHDRLCNKFGREYGEDWGWAAAALHPKRAHFANIEQSVNLDHMRPYFRLACTPTHGGSKAIWFDLGLAVTPPDAQIVLAGPSDAGFYDPGIRTAVSLLQATSNFLLCREPQMMTLIVAMALVHLRHELDEAFAKAERKLEERARRVLERSSRKRK